MRLINTTSIELHEFTNDEDVPPYAILSHTWEGQEVSFQQMNSRAFDDTVILRKGYDKIVQCCRQAARGGLEWAWVDTCCIDKISSAELSEAINAMYRWYQNSNICFTYLSDLTPASYQVGDLRKSRWFTRGWTLQELIAPKEVIFFSLDWTLLGMKTLLSDELEDITGVPKSIMLCREDVTQASIAMRMSWAAKRETTRSEDRAYCLIGLFDIHFPLIYGEGKRAFRRLQEEIIRMQPYEHTIYAWGGFSVYGEGRLLEEYASPNERHDSTKAVPFGANAGWDEELAKKPVLGILANSPADFEGCGRFVPLPQTQDYISYSWSVLEAPVFMHGGVRVQFIFLPNFGDATLPFHVEGLPIVQNRVIKFAHIFVHDPSIRWNNCLVILLSLWTTMHGGAGLKA